ncbi:MAG: GNAT family N-acetyltransferase [Phycisphaeraceae bacterium]
MLTLPLRFQSMDLSDRRDETPIVEGCRADYLALKAHHYRPGNPMTMMRVLAIRDAAPSAADRYLARPATTQPIAVLIESLPALSCRLRDEALGGRYGHLRPKQRSQLLNEELRCISRVIVDPRYRGLGLAVRLVKHALATATTRYTEALAVMGRVSPFFDRAGMAAYERPVLPVAQRALSAMRYAGIEPNELSMPTCIERRITAMPEPNQQLVTKELIRWYRTAGGRGVSKSPSLAEVLRAAQRSLLANPIYYLKENTHAPTPSPTPGITNASASRNADADTQCLADRPA